MELDIKEVTRQEAENIVNKKESIGLFLHHETELFVGKYVGIDNSTGDARVKVLDTEEECIKWLGGW